MPVDATDCVATHSSRLQPSINQLNAPVTASMFGCTGTLAFTTLKSGTEAKDSLETANKPVHYFGPSDSVLKHCQS